jgi:hypothetical protein
VRATGRQACMVVAWRGESSALTPVTRSAARR